MRNKFWLFGGWLLGLALMATMHVRAESGATGYPDSTVASGYAPDKQTAARRTSLYPADSTSVATLTSTTTGQFALLGKANIVISARFRNSADTCKVRILYQYKVNTTDYTTGLSAEATLTPSTFTDSSGFYMAPNYVFDGAGATHCRIVMTTGPTSANVDLWGGSF